MTEGVICVYDTSLGGDCRGVGLVEEEEGKGMEMQRAEEGDTVVGG